MPAPYLHQYIVFFRSAIEILEAEIKETTCDINISAMDNSFSDQTTAACEIPKMQENNLVSAHYGCKCCNVLLLCAHTL